MEKALLEKSIKSNLKTVLFTSSYAAGIYYLLVSDSSGKIINKQKVIINL